MSDRLFLRDGEAEIWRKDVFVPSLPESRIPLNKQQRGALWQDVGPADYPMGFKSGLFNAGPRGYQEPKTPESSNKPICFD